MSGHNGVPCVYVQKRRELIKIHACSNLTGSLLVKFGSNNGLRLVIKF